MWRGRWRAFLRRRAGVLRRRTRCLPLWHRLAMLLWRTAVVVSALVSAVVGATLIAVVTLVASSISGVVLRRRGKGAEAFIGPGFIVIAVIIACVHAVPGIRVPAVGGRRVQSRLSRRHGGRMVFATGRSCRNRGMTAEVSGP